ncbi:MAG: hypothetical protein ACRDCB_07515 [Clostridium sp.]|uniref:hypothetical protein n=1 Tax=Clostridium TaxID=1485 RepID=UPI00215209C6|nr:hypothetical protein [Clostridium sp. LY3-2]MCR6516235.1 hypothetical protein [Clostridium sp. LY3-2]
MGFISIALIMIIIAVIVGANINCKNIDKYLEKDILYDKDTLDILKRYELITEEQYNDMIEIVKDNL